MSNNEKDLPQSDFSEEAKRYFSEKNEPENLNIFEDDTEQSAPGDSFWGFLPGLGADRAWKRVLSGTFYIFVAALLLLAVIRGDFATCFLIIGLASFAVGGFGLLTSIVRKDAFRPFAIALVAAFLFMLIGDVLQPTAEEMESTGPDSELVQPDEDSEPDDSDHAGGEEDAAEPDTPEEDELLVYDGDEAEQDEDEGFSGSREDEFPDEHESDLADETEDEYPGQEEESTENGEEDLPDRDNNLPSFYYEDSLTVFKGKLDSNYDEWSYNLASSVVYIRVSLPGDYMDDVDAETSDEEEVIEIAEDEAYKIAEMFRENGPGYVVPEITGVDITVTYPSDHELQRDTLKTITISV